MSADNWAVCPKCFKKHEAYKEKLATELVEAYGKVPADQYLAMRREREFPKEAENTLREDYEIGILPNGKFYVSYGASCDCGFNFEFKHEQGTK